MRFKNQTVSTQTENFVAHQKSKAYAGGMFTVSQFFTAQILTAMLTLDVELVCLEPSSMD